MQISLGVKAIFEEAGLLGNVAILIASLFALDKSSDVTIDNSVKVADITGLGKTTIGFLLVAFSTSLPELSVSVFAAISQENISVAIGNVIGSNIVNICLILGICFLLIAIKNSGRLTFPTSIGKEEAQSLYFGLFIASIIPLALVYIGEASRFIGLILLILFIYNTIQLSKGGTGKEKKKEAKTVKADIQNPNKYIMWTFVGVAGVVASSYFIVDSASYIAISVGVPRIVIGATIVAFGTSLPELVTSVDATKKGHLEIALGNIVGSGFINITCILGVTLVSSTLTVNMAAFSDLVMFSIIANLFLWYFLTNQRISWREGLMLLFLYFLFLTIMLRGYRT
ncbi:sodium:calcium antiporter [Candidatus Bathyarchaeota archaeon]|nr:sodium:calcium antiporter [Candidatus Bathyarchaeota archaeon]